MAQAVIMPKAGITVESCLIGKWLKKVGDQVKLGEIIYTYETDKASFECESTAEGEILDIFFRTIVGESFNHPIAVDPAASEKSIRGRGCWTA